MPKTFRGWLAQDNGHKAHQPLCKYMGGWLRPPGLDANFWDDWSGRPGSNRRHPAWEAGVLPLNYSRSSSRSTWLGYHSAAFKDNVRLAGGSRFERCIPTAAKATTIMRSYGTTEVVPFQDTFELNHDIAQSEARRSHVPGSNAGELFL
jgi:hypothetical protein